MGDLQYEMSTTIANMMQAQDANEGMSLKNHEVTAILRLLTSPEQEAKRQTEVLMSTSSGLADAWSAAFFDQNSEYELWIIVCLFGWLTLHYFAKKIGKAYGAPLAQRPTLIANTLHCCYTGIAAAVLVLQPAETRDYNFWQRKVLPASLSYFMADFIWYCIPTGDILISCHHIVMIMCHYPVGEMASAMMCGAGNWKWAVWLSMVGYLSELSNPLLNLRWWLMQTLQKSTYRFAMVNSLVVFSFICRIILFPYLIWYHVWPRYSEFVAKQQMLAFFLANLGMIVICLMSLHWLMLLFGKGVKGLMFFERRAKASGGSFSFGEDMDREDQKKAGKADKNKAK
jgi:hypothetical protein